MEIGIARQKVKPPFYDIKSEKKHFRQKPQELVNNVPRCCNSGHLKSLVNAGNFLTIRFIVYLSKIKTLRQN